MKIKTSELTGVALDWAVENALLLDRVGNPEQRSAIATRNMRVRGESCSYCLNWAQGGPIIEREKIDCVADPNGKDVWMGQLYATRLSGEKVIRAYVPTPLIAAMRCYVASKMGDEIDIPKELT